MSVRTAVVALFVLLMPGAAQAAELPLPVAAKLLQMVSKGAGENGRVACKHEAMAAELAKIGSEVNASGKIAWASNMAEARMFSMQSKLVVGGDPSLFGGGAGLVMVQEGGRPKLMLTPRNVQKSGVHLSDAVLKAAMQ